MLAWVPISDWIYGFTLVLAQIIAAMGYGHFFPWSILALISGAAGSDNAIIEDISIIIVLLTSTGGFSGNYVLVEIC